MSNEVYIDGDLITYPCAAAAKNEPLEVAQHWADNVMKQILGKTGAASYKLFLNGKGNHRYAIYPDYKGNRTAPKPDHLEPLRQYLAQEWKAVFTEDMETDDMLGIELTNNPETGIIASFDKDLLQVPGNHYNWKKDLWKEVSPLEGLQTFYAQLIAGDGADNIPSYDGKVRQAIPKFIQELQSPLFEMTKATEMYNYCADIYQRDYFTMERNAQLLYILRKKGEYWQSPYEKSKDVLKESTSLS